MNTSIRDTGQDDFVLTVPERLAINTMCATILEAWEKDDRPFDHTTLLTTLNAGVAKAVKLVREKQLNPKGAA